jgi:hypothetical protein
MWFARQPIYDAPIYVASRNFSSDPSTANVRPNEKRIKMRNHRIVLIWLFIALLACGIARPASAQRPVCRRNAAFGGRVLCDFVRAGTGGSAQVGSRNGVWAFVLQDGRPRIHQRAGRVVTSRLPRAVPRSLLLSSLMAASG